MVRPVRFERMTFRVGGCEPRRRKTAEGLGFDGPEEADDHRFDHQTRNDHEIVLNGLR